MTTDKTIAQADEKEVRFFRRTLQHIHRVQNNMLTIVTRYYSDLKLSLEDRRRLMYQVMAHDRSKFSKVQFGPYIELTEYFHQRKNLGNKNYEYPEGVREWVDKAVEDHYNQENHHPEREHFKFTYYELLEVICDLQAMAQEFNEGTCRKFFEEVWCPKHKHRFGDKWEHVRAIMDKVIRCFEKDLREQENE